MSDNNANNPPETGTQSEFDYSNYSLDEMLEAYESIDKTVFPERAEVLRKLIIQRQPAIKSINQSEERIVASSLVKFHGNGTEYFAIWIVNLLLSIVTLGIYSAWATVRTNRYFYSNTEIVGHRLSYLAEPMQILKGRVIAVLLLAAYLIASNFSPTAGVIILLIIGLLTPFIICLGVRFRMRMMAYRNVRFNFKMRFGRAVVIFILFPIVAIITLYLAMPWVLKKIDEFLYESMEYGNKDFKTEISASEYYIAAIVASLIGFVGLVVIGIGTAIGFGLTNFEAGSNSIAAYIVFAVFAVIYFCIIVGTTSYYQAHIRNHVYNNTKIEDVALFESKVEFLPLVMLNGTNYLMLICSLGLAHPWVKVRKSRFLAEATTVSILEGINDVIATSGTQDSAVADEVIGAFDIDISIG